MTADDMEKMAEHAEHMAEWCRERARKLEGLVGVAVLQDATMHKESARWWREQRGKADLR